MLDAVVLRGRGAVTRWVLVDVFFPAERAVALGGPIELDLTDVVEADQDGPAEDVGEERCFALSFGWTVGGG